MVYRAETMRDYGTNSINRQFAFDACALRVECLIAWYDGVESSQCGKFGSAVSEKSESP